AALQDNPDEGGTWSGPVSGVYTYTFAASGSCPEDFSVVTVNYDPAPTLELNDKICAVDFQTYAIVFESNGTVSSTAGIVDNTAKTVTGIPAGTNVTLTATLNGCTTELTVTAPECGCPEIEITSVTAYPNEPVEINSPVELTVNYSSSAPVDITITWDEGVTESFPDETDGIVTATHSYPAPGVYTVTVEATNECENTVTEIYEYIVVYDPDGGFVTGGGWFMSPPGAYFADPSLIGKASFGFVAKYQKGRSKPSGHTEFQFRAANLNFNSTDYEWLVVSSDKKAQFQGTGTINGSGNYGFRISVVDGSKGAPDQLRIRIWDMDSGELIYDNQMETEISSGSIVIHSPKFKSELITSSMQIDNIEWLLDLNVFPNPFYERLRIEFISIESVNARIDILDMNGRLIRTIFEQDVESGVLYQAEFKPEKLVSSFYVYRLILGDKVESGKVIFKKE
uniref:PKD domain-containing protein n=1 Tax=Mariniphaga sp. TaxID=1954475 RepID=UPI003567A0D9